MTIEEIVKAWLESNGYDGLFYDNFACGCELNDLMPCGVPYLGCSAGYKVPCPGPEKCENDGDCPWHICETKPKGGG